MVNRSPVGSNRRSRSCGFCVTRIWIASISAAVVELESSGVNVVVEPFAVLERARGRDVELLQIAGDRIVRVEARGRHAHPGDDSR